MSDASGDVLANFVVQLSLLPPPCIATSRSSGLLVVCTTDSRPFQWPISHSRCSLHSPHPTTERELS